jgi:hypothetical protein
MSPPFFVVLYAAQKEELTMQVDTKDYKNIDVHGGAYNE